MPLEEMEKQQFLVAVEGKDAQVFFQAQSDLSEEDVQTVTAILGPISHDNLRRATNLEWLQLESAGADRYMAPGLLKDELTLTNAKGAYDKPVSEHMTAFTLSMIRRFPEYGFNQRNNQWKIVGNITTITECTILVVGLGSIGREYARQVKQLGAKCVIGVTRTQKEKPDWVDEIHTVDELDELLPRADVVALVIPGGVQTHHLMDERRLRLMKPTAMLLNVGRGNAIDPEALIQVLNEGHLYGVALDVTEPEPLPSDSPLWGIPRVMITPHSSGNTFLAGTRERVASIFLENLQRYVDDRPLLNVVDKSLGY